MLPKEPDATESRNRFLSGLRKGADADFNACWQMKKSWISEFQTVNSV